MKITRAWRGYRLTLSDGQFEALRFLADLGRMVIAEDKSLAKMQTPTIRRGLRSLEREGLTNIVDRRKGDGK